MELQALLLEMNSIYPIEPAPEDIQEAIELAEMEADDVGYLEECA